jgi:cyclophilin family peptidyl-prolyl cis-trans isomerase
MPSEKRDRQRQNRLGGEAAKLEAARQAKKKKSTVWTAALVAVLLLVVFGGAYMAGRGDDEKSVSAGSDKTEKTTTTTSADEEEPADEEPAEEEEEEASTTSSSLAGTTPTTKSTGATDCDDRKPEKTGNGKQYDAPPKMTIDTAKNYTVTFDTSCGKFTAVLDPKTAPKTVNNFVFLAREGFYDGLEWHRVVKDFVIQGGDPNGTGQGGPGYKFEDELSDNLDYKVGDLAMANAGPNTNGSQFFVVTGKDGPTILNSNPNYSLFGKVTEGLANAQKLETFNQPDDPSGRATRDLYMFKVEITESAA